MDEGIGVAGVPAEKGVLVDIVHVQGLAHSRALAHVHLYVLTLVHALFLVQFPDLVHLGEFQSCVPPFGFDVLNDFHMS